MNSTSDKSQFSVSVVLQLSMLSNSKRLQLSYINFSHTLSFRTPPQRVFPAHLHQFPNFLRLTIKTLEIQLMQSRKWSNDGESWLDVVTETSDHAAVATGQVAGRLNAGLINHWLLNQLRRLIQLCCNWRHQLHLSHHMMTNSLPDTCILRPLYYYYSTGK